MRRQYSGQDGPANTESHGAPGYDGFADDPVCGVWLGQAGTGGWTKLKKSADRYDESSGCWARVQFAPGHGCRNGIEIYEWYRVVDRLDFYFADLFYPDQYCPSGI